jgi:hypothetical protein
LHQELLSATSKIRSILHQMPFYKKSREKSRTQFYYFSTRTREVTSVYRTLVNSLIEGFEKLAYERKEKFLEFLPRVAEIISEEKAQVKSSA